MLCAEDEQSRTCWMTAFRLLKVGPLPAEAAVQPVTRKTPLCLPPTVRDRALPELQRSPAEEVQPPAVLRARGEYLLSDLAPTHPDPSLDLLPWHPGAGDVAEVELA